MHSKQSTFCFAFIACLTLSFTIPVCSVEAAEATESATSPEEAMSLQLLIRALDQSDDAGVQAALMSGMLSGMEGRGHVSRPTGWQELSSKLGDSDNALVRELSGQLSQVFGDLAAMQKSLAVLQDTSVDITVRRAALRSLLALRSEEASATLESLLDEPDLQLDAIRGYAMIENAVGPSILLGRYDDFSPENRRAVIETLASRKPYAMVLLSALRDETISREAIPVHVARSLKDLLGNRFVRVFGEIRSIGADREKQIARYKKLLSPAAVAAADASRGRAVFKKTCAACHLMYGDGGKVGPDLTGSNRANLDYILLNSVDPSFDVPAGYRMVTVLTADGRLINGVVAEEDDAKLVLKTPEQPRVVIAKSDIEDRKISDKSIMPDGQLDQMKPQEVIDLIKYLRTTEQVEMAK